MGHAQHGAASSPSLRLTARRRGCPPLDSDPVNSAAGAVAWQRAPAPTDPPKGPVTEPGVDSSFSIPAYGRASARCARAANTSHRAQRRADPEMTAIAQEASSAVRPFRVDMPEKAL